VYAKSADLIDIRAIEGFANEAIDRFQTIDVVYNNAGITLVESIEQTSLDDWERLHAVNVCAAASMVKYLLPGLRQSQAGSIINVASGAAVQAAVEGNTVYCSSKGAILALTRVQGHDLAGDRISVNLSFPVRSRRTWSATMSPDCSQRRPAARLRSTSLGRCSSDSVNRTRSLLSRSFSRRERVLVHQRCRDPRSTTGGR
jgi:NAD(P)-dependent dehydrogenase (short-subunit alcohol dehydrogenase family)